MGLAQIQHNTTSEILRMKTAVILQEWVNAQLSGTPSANNQALISAILNRGIEAAQSVTFKIVSDDAITPDSDDTTIRAAVNQASTLTHMLWKFGILPAP